jgi:hypothetical protein
MVWWAALVLGIAYFLFYLGGSYSFSYTHVCARSHKETVNVATHTNVVSHTITVCDRYGANTKHWSPGDPVRALSSERLTKYNGFVVAGIVIVVGAAGFFEWRRQRRSGVGR